MRRRTRREVHPRAGHPAVARGKARGHGHGRRSSGARRSGRCLGGPERSTSEASQRTGEGCARRWCGGPTDARTPGVTNQDASNHPEVFPANGRGVDGASALEFGGLGAARTPGLPSHDASNPHAVFPASKRWGACAKTWVARGRGSRAEVSPAQGADLRLRRRTSGNYLGRARSPPQRSGSVQRTGVQLRAKPVSLQRLVGPPTLYHIPTSPPQGRRAPRGAVVRRKLGGSEPSRPWRRRGTEPECEPRCAGVVSTALRSPPAVDANVRLPHPGGRARRRARTGGPAVHEASALRAGGPRPGQAPCASHQAPLDRPRSLPVHVAALRCNHLAAADGARRVHRRAHARRSRWRSSRRTPYRSGPLRVAPRSPRATSTALDETSTPSCQAFWAMRSGPLRVDPSCPEPPRSLRRPRHPAPRAHCAMEWPQAARDIAQPRAIDHSPPMSTRASATQVGPTAIGVQLRGRLSNPLKG
jgi:hypothetical protein